MDEITLSYRRGDIIKTHTMSVDSSLNEVLDEFHLFLAAIGYGVDPMNNILEIAPHPATGERYCNTDSDVPF